MDVRHAVIGGAFVVDDFAFHESIRVHLEDVTAQRLLVGSLTAPLAEVRAPAGVSTVTVATCTAAGQDLRVSVQDLQLQYVRVTDSQVSGRFALDAQGSVLTDGLIVRNVSRL